MQPVGRPIRFHLDRRGRVEPVGVVHVTRDGQRDMRSSRAALAAAIRAGLFTARAELSTVLEFHYRTEDDWNEFLSRPRTGAVEAEPEALAGALAVLSQEDAVIVAREETHFRACDRAGDGARGAAVRPR